METIISTALGWLRCCLKHACGNCFTAAGGRAFPERALPSRKVVHVRKMKNGAAAIAAATAVQYTRRIADFSLPPKRQGAVLRAPGHQGASSAARAFEAKRECANPRTNSFIILIDYYLQFK